MNKPIIFSLLLLLFCFSGCKKNDSSNDLTVNIVGNYKYTAGGGAFVYNQYITKVDNNTVSFKIEPNGFTIYNGTMENVNRFTFNSPFTNNIGQRDTVIGECNFFNNTISYSYTVYYFQQSQPSMFSPITTSTKVP